jgi:hypothetical protein
MKHSWIIGCIALAAIATSANASTLNLNLTADNEFKVYLSTNDADLGSLVGSGNNWQQTYPFSVELGSASTYYLHIIGTNWTNENGFPQFPRFDANNPNALIGSFNITGGGFVFGNGASSISTDTTHWKAIGVDDNTSWTTPTGAPQSFGLNGASPWGTRPNIDSSAEFIWSNPDNRLYSDFSIQISAVPEASTWAMMILGFLGLGLFGYRKTLKASGAGFRVA